jgi:hypothetical protein
MPNRGAPFSPSARLVTAATWPQVKRLTQFANVPLEHLLEVIKEAGGDVAELQARYTDWRPVHDAVDNFLIGATVQAA